jgi:hypothetical protein
LSRRLLLQFLAPILSPNVLCSGSQRFRTPLPTRMTAHHHRLLSPLIS